jgi:hypothetical protein
LDEASSFEILPSPFESMDLNEPPLLLFVFCLPDGLVEEFVEDWELFPCPLGIDCGSVEEGLVLLGLDVGVEPGLLGVVDCATANPAGMSAATAVARRMLRFMMAPWAYRRDRHARKRQIMCHMYSRNARRRSAFCLFAALKELPAPGRLTTGARTRSRNRYR